MATGWGRFRRYDPPARGSTVSHRLRIAHAEGPLQRYRPGNRVPAMQIEIAPVHGASFGVCGPKKVSTRSRRDKGGTSRVARLMADIDIKRFIRSKRKR